MTDLPPIPENAIYIVTSGDYSDYGIDSAHLDPEAAHRAAWSRAHRYGGEALGYSDCDIEVFDPATGDRVTTLTPDIAYGTDAHRQARADAEARQKAEAERREAEATAHRERTALAQRLTRSTNRQQARKLAQAAGLGLVLLCDITRDGTVTGEQAAYLNDANLPAENVNVTDLGDGTLRIQVLGTEYAKVEHSYGEQKNMWQARRIGLDQ